MQKREAKMLKLFALYILTQEIANVKRSSAKSLKNLNIQFVKFVQEAFLGAFTAENTPWVVVYEVLGVLYIFF